MKFIVRLGALLAAAYILTIPAAYLALHDWSEGQAFDPDSILGLPTSLSATAATRAPAERQLCCPFSFATDPGDGAMTFRVREGQPKIEGAMRSEVRALSSRIGETYRYRAEIRPETGWVATPDPTIALQWHGTKDLWFLEYGRRPPLALHAVGNEWVVAINADPRLVSPLTKSTQHREIARLPLDPGTWHSFDFTVRWSPEDDGQVVVRHNGRIVARDRGPNCYNDLLGPYFKFGNYQPSKRNYPTAAGRAFSLRDVAWQHLDGADVD